MRELRKYPNARYPLASGEVFYDDESDDEVAFLHYRGFLKPGLCRRINAVIAIEKASGQAHVIDGDKASIDALRRYGEEKLLGKTRILH